MNQLDVLVNGKPVRKFAHQGKTFIVAKPGTRYEIRVKNNSSSRIMAVTSVDGLSVLDGQICKPEGPGYVIEGYNSYTIKGWRTSNDEVNAFEFSKKSKSYAAKSENGNPDSVGVIACAIHAGKVPEPKVTHHYHYNTWPNYVYPYRKPYITTEPYWYSLGGTSGNSCSNNVTFTSSLGGSQMSGAQNQGMLRSCNLVSQVTNDSAPAEFDMGTKFSEVSLDDQVSSTTFKSSHITDTIEIYYASESKLRAMGVPVDKGHAVAFPQAFGGFCKPPTR